MLPVGEERTDCDSEVSGENYLGLLGSLCLKESSRVLRDGVGGGSLTRASAYDIAAGGGRRVPRMEDGVRRRLAELVISGLWRAEEVSTSEKSELRRLLWILCVHRSILSPAISTWRLVSASLNSEI